MKPWETNDTFIARWLSGELSPAELEEFKSSPDYEAYVKTSQALDDFEVGEYDAEAALSQLKAKLPSSEKENKRKIIPLWVWAAAAVLLALFGVMFWSSPEESIVEIIAAEKQAVSLPDGSSISLQIGSTLRYDEEGWPVRRAVSLEGQAYFDVKNQSELEGAASVGNFVINLKEGSVTVLGTRFNVQERADTLLVTCYEGKVEVEAHGFKDQLTQGESVKAHPGALEQLGLTRLEQPIWMNAVIQLKSVSLEEVVAQLEEVYGILVVGDYPSEERFTGAFPVQDLDVALSQVFGPFELSFHIDSARHVVTVE